MVLLLETMLAFADKEPLLAQVASALSRRAIRLHDRSGPPADDTERERMPDADTVWLTPLDEMLASLDRAGLAVGWQEDHSQSHRTVADSLIEAFRRSGRHHRADRRAGTGRTARRAPAVERLATGRTGAQDRARRSEGLSVTAHRDAPRLTPAHVSRLGPQLSVGGVAFAQVLKAHPVDHRGSLGELDVPVVDDLDLVAPRVAKVKPRAGKDLDATLSKTARVAGLSSTTRPKWRAWSGG